jgi:hypothetical protein
VPFLRFTRDKRGYEQFALVHPTTNRRGKVRTRVLYWYRTPPEVRVGREPFDPAVRKALETQNPDITFDWRKILDTPIPSAETERWRERRRAEKAEKAARRAEAAAEAAAAAGVESLTPESADVADGDDDAIPDAGGDELTAAAPEDAEEEGSDTCQTPERGDSTLSDRAPTAAVNAPPTGDPAMRRRRRRRGRRRPGPGSGSSAV